MTPGRQHNAGAGVGFGRDPGAVERVGHQEEGHHHHKEPGYTLLLTVVTQINCLVSVLFALVTWLAIADTVR